MHNLSELQQDALLEIFNVSIGRAASAMSDMVSETINMSVPAMQFLTRKEAGAYYTPDAVVTTLVHWVVREPWYAVPDNGAGRPGGSLALPAYAAELRARRSSLGRRTAQARAARGSAGAAPFWRRTGEH